MLSDKQSIQEVTHESPPHNSHVATLKLQGPPILPWKLYKRYIGKRLTKEEVKGDVFSLVKAKDYTQSKHLQHMVCYVTPKTQTFTKMTNLMTSIQWVNVTGVRYLAGRGFVSCL